MKKNYQRALSVRPVRGKGVSKHGAPGAGTSPAGLIVKNVSAAKLKLKKRRM